MAGVAQVGRTGDQAVDGILSGVKWADHRLTVSFPERPDFYGTPYGSGEPATNFRAFDAAQKAAARASLASYAAVANLAFTEITETAARHADLRFALSDRPGTAWAYFPSDAAEAGDSWYNGSSGWYDDVSRGGYGFHSLQHEIGHALGLKHGHESGGLGKLPADRDSMEYTIMTYHSYVGSSATATYTNQVWSYPQSLMPYDIAALQHMYGANYGANRGNTVYSWSPTTGELFVNGVGQGAPGGNHIFMTVWDGGGVDGYDLSAYAGGVRIDLQPGGWVVAAEAQLARLSLDGVHLASGNIASALLHDGDPRALIENAIGGSGDDVIVGNVGGNLLLGGAGRDFLDGGAGIDNLRGDSGNDTLLGSEGNDRLVGGAGSDRLQGGPGADELRGESGADVLLGGPAGDKLYGGFGADRLSGGPGTDRFFLTAVGESGANAATCDVITDFEPGIDVINLAKINAVQGGGNAAFLFIGTDAFTAAGQLRFEPDAGRSRTLVEGNVDQDLAPDFRIELFGLHDLGGADFVL